MKLGRWGWGMRGVRAFVLSIVVTSVTQCTSLDTQGGALDAAIAAPDTGTGGSGAATNGGTGAISGAPEAGGAGGSGQSGGTGATTASGGAGGSMPVMPGLDGSVSERECSAGTARCEGNTVMTCADDGRSELAQPCPARCTGEGTCVECVTPADCDEPENPCAIATCDADGACGAGDRAATATCPTGACDGAGSCKCRDHDDCPGALNVCLPSGACADNTCGDGATAGAEECDDGNRTTTDACADCLVAECGDGYVQSGVEECDPIASGWSIATCDDKTCEIKVYTPCMSSADCTGGYSCYLGGCAPYGDKPCPTIPGWPVAGPGFNSGCQLRCVDGACPFGMICDDFGTGPTCSMEDI